jgi:hypothetical protein
MAAGRRLSESATARVGELLRVRVAQAGVRCRRSLCDSRRAAISQTTTKKPHAGGTAFLGRSQRVGRALARHALAVLDCMSLT